MAKLRRVSRVALCHKRKKASDLLLCFRMCSGRVFSIGAFLCCIVFIREEGTKKIYYCCPLNFKTTHFPYPQRPSIGVADFFFEK